MKGILLLDEKTNKLLADDLTLKERLKQEFEVKTKEDLQNWSDKNFLNRYIGIYKFVSPLDYRILYPQYLIEFNLYKNTFANILDFDVWYWWEYQEILAGFMRCVEGFYRDSVLFHKTQEELENDKNKKFKEFPYITEKDLCSLKKLNKQKIQKWLEEEKIDVESLPYNLKKILKDALEEKELHREYHYKEQAEIISQTVKERERALGILASIVCGSALEERFAPMLKRESERYIYMRLDRASSFLF